MINVSCSLLTPFVCTGYLCSELTVIWTCCRVRFKQTYFMDEKMLRYKLSYFDGMGSAETARWIFAFAKVPFEDHRFSFEEWKNVKNGNV